MSPGQAGAPRPGTRPRTRAIGVGEWLLCLTPAAGFAVQQSIPVYEQVVGHYVPAAGYLPLPPWAGLAVLCAYTGLALVLAMLRLRRSDA